MRKKGDAGFGGIVSNSRIVRSDIHNFPRMAKDDSVDFMGANVSVLAPAGLGKMVYAKIMEEIASSDKVDPSGQVESTISAAEEFLGFPSGKSSDPV